jgi:hypothetical protein
LNAIGGRHCVVPQKQADDDALFAGACPHKVCVDYVQVCQLRTRVPEVFCSADQPINLLLLLLLLCAVFNCVTQVLVTASLLPSWWAC